MRGLERRNNSFGFGERAKCGQCFVVGRVGVLDATGVAQITVLWPNGGVIQSGGNGMRELDLSVGIRQHECAGPLQHPELSALKSRGVFS